MSPKPANALSWKTLALRVILPPFLTVILFTAAAFLIYLPATEAQHMARKRESLRYLVQSRTSSLQSRAMEVKEGRISREEAQLRAIRRLRDLRYGKDGKDYFWILRMDGQLLMHPYRNDLEGTNVRDFTDPAGTPLFREMVTIAKGPGSGFLTYRWQWKDIPTRIVPKVSYVRKFDPWNWIIGTGVYIDDVQAEIARLREQFVWIAGGILLLTLLLCGFIVWQGVRTEGARARALAELERERDMSRALMEAAQAFVVILARDGTVRMMNRAMLNALGCEAGDVTGGDYVELAIPEWNRAHIREILSVILQRVDEGSRVEETGTNPIIDRNGDERLVEWSITLLENHEDDAPLLLCVGLDVTENRKLEEQLHHAQKLDAIGRLAGGIAHDFNNQIGGILGYAELLSTQIKDERQRRYARSIIEVAENSADLIDKLLTFSRKGQHAFAPVELNAIVNDVVEMLEHTVDKRIRIKRSLREGGITVPGDVSQLQNALLNLGLNARDAMPEGGEILFQTETITIDEDFCRTHPHDIRPGEFARITVSDTGCGIPPEIRDRAFEPFFTTKEKGKGTGLGLAAVYGTVKAHSGGIDLYSEVGHGTTFRIYLPLGSDSPGGQAAPGQSGQQTAIRGDGRRLLLVDDEESVREMTATHLRNAGYAVDTFGEGADAVEFFRENHCEIDMVLLDMIMPNMNGRAVFDALREIDPNVRAILISGFTQRQEAEDILNDGVLGFLQKPLRSHELLAELARLLSESE